MARGEDQAADAGVGKVTAVVPRYIIRWPDRCAWCGDQMWPDDLGSYSLEDLPVHLACRMLEQP